MKRKWYAAISEFVQEQEENNLGSYAASTAFFFFLSLMPMLALVCSILPYTPLTEENLLQAVTAITPDELDFVAENLVREVYDKSAGIVSVAAVVTVWSAGKGMLALMRGLNAVHKVREERNYFFVRIIASAYTVIMLAAMVLSLVFLVFGRQLVQLLLEKLPMTDGLISSMLRLRFLVLWAVLALVFALIDTYVPGCRLRFVQQLPGAVLSAIGWGVFSWGFSFYIKLVDGGSVYGSLSVIVMVLIWMYFCMYIMLMGAWLNCFLAKREGKV